MIEDLLMFLGSALCHQLPERSYFLDGVQMPLCARCIGIHFGFVLSAIYLSTGPRRFSSVLPRVWQLAVLGAIMSIFLIDSILSYSGLSTSDNLRRTLSGLALGVPLPFLLVPLLNYILFPKVSAQPVLDKPTGFLWMAVLYASGAAAILLSTRYEPLFWGVSLAGIVGMFVFFTLALSVETSILLERRQLRGSQKIALGAVIAIILLLLLALLHDTIFPAS
jgi:uncharacterized membrane protein